MTLCGAALAGRRATRRVRAAVTAAVAAGALAACSGPGSPGAGTGAAATEITVAAASDLRFAFEELAEAFRARTGVAVRLAFGSSGQLREQIINGAPFDLFAAADADFVDAVIEAGVGLADTRADYAIGRIALVAPPGSDPPGSVEELSGPAYRRIAIANPTHAPYGLAAQEALGSAGILEQVDDRLVVGENVSDALRIVRSGSVDAGIVALSLALADGAPHTLVDDDQHAPLRQALVVTSSGSRGAAARSFAAFVASPAGREVMVRHGFALPGEEATP